MVQKYRTSQIFVAGGQPTYTYNSGDNLTLHSNREEIR